MAETRVAVIGAGLIGRAWAISFARAGCAVALYDADLQAAARAREAIGARLEDLEENELLDGTAREAQARVAVAGSLAEALRDAAHVQENAPEELDVKIAVTKEIAELAGPQTVIASSTSGFVPSLYSEQAPGRQRCLVAHPINPPYLVPAVELVPAPWTDPEIVERARAFYEGIGHSPISLRREIDGFVVNRLQGALLHEAFRLVAGGYVSAADLDRAICEGLGLRWSFMGPFETIDLNAPGGIRDYVERYGPLYRRLAETQAVPCDWLAALDAGIEAERTQALPRAALAGRQTWRDRRLMALAAHKRRAHRKHGR